MIAHPNGDLYVTDGYRNARVHRFTREGRLVKSWGEPGRGAGQFHLPHTIAIDDDGKLYVGDRSNKRIQIFTPEGDYLTECTGMAGPNDISRGKDGNFYIAEQEDDAAVLGQPGVDVAAGVDADTVDMAALHAGEQISPAVADADLGGLAVDKFVRVG